ncbi:MAG: hypothetical protein WCG82_00860 [Bacteroidota bacterium]
MRAITKLTILLFLSLFITQNITARYSGLNEIVMQEQVSLKTTSQRHLTIGINELITVINKSTEMKIKPLSEPYTLKDDSVKIKEIGAFLKYNIVVTNDLLGCCKAFDDIVEKYYMDKNERVKFYKKVNKLEKENQR